MILPNIAEIDTKDACTHLLVIYCLSFNSIGDGNRSFVPSFVSPSSAQSTWEHKLRYLYVENPNCEEQKGISVLFRGVSDGYITCSRGLFQYSWYSALQTREIWWGLHGGKLGSWISMNNAWTSSFNWSSAVCLNCTLVFQHRQNAVPSESVNPTLSPRVIPGIFLPKH